MIDRRHQQPITAAAGGCTASFDAARCSIETGAQKGHFALNYGPRRRISRT
jgi:hypothetical protein